MKQMYEQHPFLPHIVWRAVSFSAVGWKCSAWLSLLFFPPLLILAWPQFVAFLLRFAIFKEDRCGFCLWPWSSLIGVTWGLPCHQRLSSPCPSGSVLPAPIYRACKLMIPQDSSLPIPTGLYWPRAVCVRAVCDWESSREQFQGDKPQIWGWTLRSSYKLLVKNIH